MEESIFEIVDENNVVVAEIYGPDPDIDEPKSERKLLKKETITSEIRWEIWERDNFTCLSCGGRRNLSIDHIVPECKGGVTEPHNLQTLCMPCNAQKGSK